MNHTADDGIANAMDAIDYGTIVILATANAVVLSAGAYYLHKFPSFAGTRTPVEDGTALYKIGRFAQLLAFCTGVLSLVTLGWGKFAKQSTHLDTDTDIGLFFIKYHVKTTTKDAEPISTAGVVIICDKEVDDDDDDLAVVRDEVPFYNANGAGAATSPPPALSWRSLSRLPWSFHACVAAALAICEETGRVPPPPRCAHARSAMLRAVGKIEE